MVSKFGYLLTVRGHPNTLPALLALGSGRYLTRLPMTTISSWPVTGRLSRQLVLQSSGVSRNSDVNSSSSNYRSNEAATSSSLETEESPKISSSRRRAARSCCRLTRMMIPLRSLGLPRTSRPA